MQTPILHGEFIYKNVKYHTDFYNLIGQEIPNLPWSQVYIIGNLKKPDSYCKIRPRFSQSSRRRSKAQ